jgi:hypothetical protein
MAKWNKNLTALKSKSVWFNFQTYIYIYIRLKIKPNSVRIRFSELSNFCSSLDGI